MIVAPHSPEIGVVSLWIAEGLSHGEPRRHAQGGQHFLLSPECRRLTVLDLAKMRDTAAYDWSKMSARPLPFNLLQPVSQGGPASASTPRLHPF